MTKNGFLRNIWKDKNGCWVWTASRFKNGYGQCRYQDQSKAHRVSWLIHRGVIPKGVCVLHRCDNRPCVNPQHLFLGSQKDNMRDMILKGRDDKVKGVRHPQAKMTDKDIRQIRKLHKDGKTQRSLCRLFSISPGHMHGIIHRRYWKHVA